MVAIALCMAASDYNRDAIVICIENAQCGEALTESGCALSASVDLP